MSPPRWLALAWVGIVACSRFSGDVSPGPDVSDASTDALTEASNEDAATPPPPPCAGGVRVIEGFGSKSLNGSDGLWKIDSSNHGGSLDVASDDLIGVGLAAPYLRVRAPFTDLSHTPPQAEAAINRLIPGRPSKVSVSFKVGLGTAIGSYAEYGCAIFLREAGLPQSSTYFYLHNGDDPRAAIVTAQRTPNNDHHGDIVFSPIGSGEVRAITMTVSLTQDGYATATASDGAASQTIPEFSATSPIDETFVQCGLAYGAREDAVGNFEVGVDDVDLTVCP